MPLTYVTPGDPAFLHEDDVRKALDFLIAVEPTGVEAQEEYRAAVAPYLSQVDAAMATLRGFAEQTEPLTLEELQRAYYGLTNDPRYLVSPTVSSVVTSVLQQAWNGVGPWRN